MFDLGDLSGERFVREHWRRQPLYLKGGARLLIERRLDVPEIRVLADRRGEANVRRRKGVLSVMGLDTESLELRNTAERLRAALSVRRARVDALVASAGEGSECKFERGDVFVLVDRGVQRWRLCPPDILSARELRARMLDEPDSGFIHMPDECLDYVLGEEDLLYVPLFWGQWGVATAGPSLSLSVTLEAESPLELLLPLLAGVLADERSWWYPLETLPELPSGSDPPEPVGQVFDALLGALRRDSFDKKVKAAWWRAYGRVVEKESRSRTPSEIRRERVLLEELGLDPERVERLRTTEVLPPDPMSAAQPGPEPVARLRALLARQMIGELFEAVLASATVFPDVQAAQPIYEIARVLQHGDLESMAPVLVRPEVVSWLWRMSEALSFKRRSYFEEIAYPATRLLLPALLRMGGQTRGLVLPIGRSDELSMNLLGNERRIVSPVPLATRMEVSFVGPMLRFASTAGVLAEFPAEAVTDRGRVDVGSGFFIEDLPVEPSTGVVLLDRDSWVFGQYPKGRRFGARSLEVDGMVGVADSIPQMAAELEASSAALFRELRASISLFLPMAGGDGRVQTVPPFIGAIALSRDARARDLAEELGRTKARLALRSNLAVAPSTPEKIRVDLENFAARAYRCVIDGGPNDAAISFDGHLTEWGRGFVAGLRDL